MIKRRKREKDRYYILKTKSNMTYCTHIVVYCNEVKTLNTIHLF